jgi:uncharacterized protein
MQPISPSLKLVGSSGRAGTFPAVLYGLSKGLAPIMSTRGAFVVSIHDLDVSGRNAEFSITPAWLRGALEGCEMQPAGPEGRLDVHLSKTGSEVLVQGQVDVQLVVPCARCLDPVALRPHIELSLLLFPATPDAPQGAPKRSPAGSGPKGAPSHTKDEEFDGEEADADTYEGDEVVLDRFVREAILLESPTFPLCSEACEGIRPASESAPGEGGAVTDPRLLPLLELAKRKNWKE